MLINIVFFLLGALVCYICIGIFWILPLHTKIKDSVRIQESLNKYYDDLNGETRTFQANPKPGEN